MNKKCLLYLSVFVAFSVKDTAIYGQHDTVSIIINTKKVTGPYTPLWSFFGCDEANYTTMKDGKKLLSELAAISKNPVYMRVHNLLTSGDGRASLKWSSTNAYTEDKKGNPVYSWAILDSIFDVFISRGIRPIAEIGFMPEALSVKPQPYRHHWKPGVPYDSIYTGWAYPPGDYKKWSRLVYEWVRHCIKRYGEAEIKSWYWEVWNEPNIGYWKGSMQEYFKLYDYTADAVKKACPFCNIGGPTTTGPRWIEAADFLKEFLQHCVSGKNYATGKTGAPLDYITFHAKGAPAVVNNSVEMNMGVQLQDVAKGFEIINTFPALKHLPVIIGEFDPEGCAACSVQFSPQNAYRNGTMYSSYTAASFAWLYALRKKYDINLTGAVSWSFEFENQPWFAGFRDLATNGVDKPVLNIFRMFGKMKGNMLEVINPKAPSLKGIIDNGIRGDKNYIDALATSNERNIYILVWNYHDNDSRNTDALIKIALQQLSAARVSITCFLVDEDHSNAYTLWKKMGSPQQVSEEKFIQLRKAGQLQMTSENAQLKVLNKTINYRLLLAKQGVALLKVSW